MCHSIFLNFSVILPGGLLRPRPPAFSFLVGFTWGAAASQTPRLFLEGLRPSRPHREIPGNRGPHVLNIHFLNIRAGCMFFVFSKCLSIRFSLCFSTCCFLLGKGAARPTGPPNGLALAVSLFFSVCSHSLQERFGWRSTVWAGSGQIPQIRQFCADCATPERKSNII